MGEDREFLRATWRHLAMASWPVDPALLAPLVPAGTELDLREGTAYASLVGFRFLDARVLGWAVPGHRDFDEVNLRFYLRRRIGGRWERGVGFAREFVPRRAIAWLALRVYNEPYLALPMESTIGAGRVEYRWKLGRWNRLAMDVPGAPGPAGGLDGWIAEHYFGWTRQRDGGTVEYRVEHPAWKVRAASRVEVDADLAACYGAEWGRALSGAPVSAFVAEGSEVTVGRPVRLDVDPTSPPSSPRR